MSRLEKHNKNFDKWYKSWTFYIAIFSILLVFSLFIYSRVSIHIEAPKQNLGEKVVIHMPTGKTVYTYENLITRKDGKLFYKGERNTIDLTGGIVVYENWK